MGKVIGIDLGTTFSCMAYINESGQPEVIRNSEGDTITPSTVLFEDGSTVVGKAAKDQSLLDPENVEQFVKRHMGERDYVFTTTDGQQFSPEAISSLVLKKLKQDAEEALGDTIDGAVITVPAYFNDAQRKATMDAGRIAGLNVLAIINEPTAAALAFGIAKGGKSETIMVYDLGGGTFDVTIMRFQGEDITVLGTSGNRKLGGYDFDNKIIKAVLEGAKDAGLTVREDPELMQELQLKAEEAKKILSSAQKSTIAVKINGKPYKHIITREDFETMIEPLLFSTISSMENACDEAGLTYEDIDKILLVGGSTRIPAVKECIKSETGVEPSAEVHPDEAVAIGAAFYALDAAKRRMAEDREQGTSEEKALDVVIPETKSKYTFTDVTSHGIGIVVLDEFDKKVNSIVLPKNVKVPAQCKKDGYSTTVPYQEKLRIEVTQGEDTDLRYVSIIGTADIAVSPREQLVPIEVTISCDENSIIHVRVFDLGLKRDLGEIRIDRVSNLTEEEIRANQMRISKLDISGD